MTPIIVFLILSLDQLSKLFITQTLTLNQSLPVIKGVFHLTLIYNRGAAFGMMKNQTALFISTSLLALVLIYFDLKKNRLKNRIYDFALSLIAAGAAGNLIDRIFLGHVVDFLDFRVWPVFNIADSAITIGAILLGYSLIKLKS